MNNENPFFMNFDVTDFMSKFAVPNMNNEYSKKLMKIHQKNLDAYVQANKVVTDGYKSIANKQMEIFQDSLIKMASYTQDQTSEITQDTFKESTEQMQTLMEMATKTHKDAFAILSSRAEEMVSESKQ